MAKKVYLTFPVSLIPSLYEKKDVYEGMADMINYGIFVFMKGQKKAIREALNEMGISWAVSDSEALKTCENVVKKCGDSRVFTGIESNRAYSIRDSKISYKDNADEVMALCGELALKSIIGIRPYNICFKSILLSRMSGFAKVIDEKGLKDAVKRFSGSGGKRQWRKLIALLKKRGCAFYTPAGCHGFYASFKYTPVGLARIVEAKRKEGKETGRTEYDLSNQELQRIANGRTPK